MESGYRAILDGNATENGAELMVRWWRGWSDEAGKLSRPKRDGMIVPGCVATIPRDPARSRTERPPQRDEPSIRTARRPTNTTKEILSLVKARRLSCDVFHDQRQTLQNRGLTSRRPERRPCSTKEDNRKCSHHGRCKSAQQSPSRSVPRSSSK